MLSSISTGGQDSITRRALEGGAVVPPLAIPELSECVGCEPRGDHCDFCRCDPEPVPTLEIQRLCEWIGSALKEIKKADDHRLHDGRPLDDAAYLAATSAAISNFNDDGERLVSLHDSAADAQQLSGELRVGHTLVEGGQ